jgi:hypothetical protein
MSLSAQSGLLNGALAGTMIKSAEVIQEEGYQIIRLTTEHDEVVAITGLGLDFAVAANTPS